MTAEMDSKKVWMINPECEEETDAILDEIAAYVTRIRYQENVGQDS